MDGTHLKLCHNAPFSCPDLVLNNGLKSVFYRMLRCHIQVNTSLPDDWIVSDEIQFLSGIIEESSLWEQNELQDMLIFDQILISLLLFFWRDLKQFPSGIVEISHFPEWGRAYWTADSRTDKQTHVSLGQSNDAESDDVPVQPSTSRPRRWSRAWYRRREGQLWLRSKSYWWKRSTSHTAYGPIAYTK